MKLPLTGDPKADELLGQEPLALLMGMLLDQQVPMEKAFRGPPALHRYPGSMAGRTQELCRALVERYDGDAERVWLSAETGQELVANLKALPGFGEQKARIFTALLAKRVGVTPPGWEDAAGPYAQIGHFSVADVDGPDALALVREHKKAMKAAARAAPSPMKP